MSFSNAADQVEEEVAGTVTTPTGTPEGSNVTVLEDGRMVVNGKVFTPEGAAKKMEHGDTHIQKLVAEAAARDEQLEKALDRIKAMEEKAGHADSTEALAAAAKEAAAAAVAAAAPEQSPTQEISKEEMLAALKDDLKAEKLEAQRKTNLETIVQEAKDFYGDEFGEKVDGLAASHGMTPADAVEMANDKPAVFRALFLKGAPTKKAGPDSTGGSVGTGVGQQEEAPPKRQSFTRIRGAKERKAYIDARYAEIAARNS